ncbi:glucose-6-phosphate isomerase [Lacticaseibacillus parakribbianus]|uniref:glucose-6-phosphate isomerase n=1 Tax=Lacticaseibacillus parakribbianus TaxID=2970927 RepID=UPI0021CAE87C|nr:glucose-6-phosphate isomerase [Lacticaseibacillus parakribbianus]
MIEIETQTTATLAPEALAAYRRDHVAVLQRLLATKPAGDSHEADLGWLTADKWAPPARLSALTKLAKQVQRQSQVLVVVGVGGSNQAARAAIAALQPDPAPCEIVYAGVNLSAAYYQRLLASLADRDVTIDVIAKNFQTLEPGIGFRVFKPFLVAKYGEDYASHLIVTGTPGSAFEQLATAAGYPFLTFPEDIGGRFSALSAVGLFPMAVAGIDIAALVEGAKAERAALVADDSVQNPAYAYASLRQFWRLAGGGVEVLAHFEPQLDYFGRWWTQLFAESEGKNNSGLYPVALSYSEDLHSLGQYVQQGQRFLAETFLKVATPVGDLTLQPSGVADGFDYLDGLDLAAVNRVAEAATIQAHQDCGVPVTVLTLPGIDAASFGALFYFFEFAVFISATLQGVNPFDQPGVEAYKALMFAGLHRP